MRELSSEAIKDFIKSVLPKVLSAYFQEKERELYAIPLLKRLIRLEVELKAIRLFEKERHATLLRDMDKRFEALHREINARFEALEKRFSFLQWLTIFGFPFVSFFITVLNFGEG